MEFQNYKLYHNYSNKEAKLLLLERRQNIIINILKRECEKIAVKPDPKVHQKLWIRKRVEANYTLKLPKYDRVKAICRHEEETTKVNEKKQIRKKMISAGNSFSKMNMFSSVNVNVSSSHRKPCAIEIKQKMLEKAKQLGNRYSMIFNLRENLQRSLKHLALDKFDQLRLLLARKKKAENFYESRKINRWKVSDSFLAKYSRLVDEIKELWNILGHENQICCGETAKEILKLNEVRREKLMEKLKVPYSQEQSLSSSSLNIATIEDTVEIDKVLKTSRVIQETLKENFEDGELFNKLSMNNLKLPTISEEKSSTESSRSIDKTNTVEVLALKHEISESAASQPKITESPENLHEDKFFQENATKFDLKTLSPTQSFSSDCLREAETQNDEKSALEFDQKSFSSPHDYSPQLCPNNTVVSSFSDGNHETVIENLFHEHNPELEIVVAKLENKTSKTVEKKTTENSENFVTKLRELLKGSKEWNLIDDDSSPKPTPSCIAEVNHPGKSFK